MSITFLLILSFLIVPPQIDNVFGDYKPVRNITALQKDNYAPSEEIKKLELKMLQLINAERRAKGLQPLIYNEILGVIARNHSKEMAEYEAISHYSPVYGFGLKERIKPTIPYFDEMSENVVRGKNIQDIHKSLLRSPLHYKNIINPNAEVVGIGIFKKAQFLYFVSQIFSPQISAEQIPSDINYYFEKPPPERAKVVTKRSQQGFSFRATEEERIVSEGLDFYRQGKNSKAIEKYKEALKLNPKYFYAYFNLGLLYFNSNRLNEALENFNKALAQKPKDGETLFYISWIHFDKGEYELAEKHALLLLNDELYEPEIKMYAHFLLGRIYDQMGRRKEAISYYEEFIKQSKVAEDKDLHYVALAIKRLQLLKEREERRLKRKP